MNSTTLVEELYDMVDEASLWDVLNALEAVIRNMAGPNFLGTGPNKIVEGLAELQHVAFTYRL